MKSSQPASAPDSGVSCPEEAVQFALIDPGLLSSIKEDVILLEAHFSSVDHPLDPEMPIFRHIPGAIQIHPSYLEAGLNRSKYYPNYDHPVEANILEPAELAPALEHLGITPDSTVVVYGSDPDGVMASARLVWGLMYAGVKRVRLLDGGLDAWIEHGLEPCFKTRNVWDLDPPMTSATKHSWSFKTEYLATSSDVGRFVEDGRCSKIGQLIDVRTEGEWDGTTPKKYPFFTRAGHIPGALHQGNWDNLMDGSSKRLAPHLEVVARRWRAQGLIDEQVSTGNVPLTFYCGTGWRSSIAFLVAHLLGFQAKNYDDGFFGWSHHPENPISRDNTCTPGEALSVS